MAGKGPRKLRLSTNPTPQALAELRLGDVVYQDGTIYTAREGVDMRALEEKANIPMELPAKSAANFHCSPAASMNADGSFNLGAVTATASFRFSKWIGDWMAASGAKLIIGKGGMSAEDYRQHFVPNGSVYLTTVGYGDYYPLSRNEILICIVYLLVGIVCFSQIMGSFIEIIQNYDARLGNENYGQDLNNWTLLLTRFAHKPLPTVLIN